MELHNQHVIDSPTAANLDNGLLTVLASSIFFHSVSVLIAKFGTPKEITATGNKSRIYQWKNISVSLAHSCVAGIAGVICIYNDANLATASNMINYYTTTAYLVICIPVGYFIHDTIDLIRFNRKRESYELLLHHAIIILCFGIAIYQRCYVAYAVIALPMEINSIFLHSRQLMRLIKVPKTNTIYRYNSLINIGTFIVFRIGILAWMTRWIMINRDDIPVLMYAIGCSGLAIMTVMNIVLFYRLLLSDFVSMKEKSKEV